MMSRTSGQIRREFIRFFEDRGHTFVPSSSLLPPDDPTLLFANAGMNQFKDVFLGTGTRPYTRAVNSQKCIRAGGKHNDLEDVGHDTHHQTFFEMLGNWSFGDYFKAEAIQWSWELLTRLWRLPKDRLYATVFGGDEREGLPPDEESAGLWPKVTDMPAGRVLPFGMKDNFWGPGDTGPCGPCSEIHIDLGADRCDGSAHPGQPCAVNAPGCRRFIELWNLVFIQFNRTDAGGLEPLPARHVDTGLGLERVCAVLQGKASNYDTDVFAPLLEWLQRHSGMRYGAAPDTDVAFRVCADHARACCFAIADGVLPSNEGRGYVIRRILRRAARYGRKLDQHEPFLHMLVPVLVQQMGEVYPELARRADQVAETIRQEEVSFNRTLDEGIRTWWHFAGEALWLDFKKQQQSKPSGPRYDMIPSGSTARFSEGTRFSIYEMSTQKCVRQFDLESVNPDLIEELYDTPPQIEAQEAFKLYDTYGFPLDLTELMARERGLTVDSEGFQELMEEARQRSRGETSQAAALTGLPETDDSAKYGGKPIQAKVLGWAVGGSYVTEGELAEGAEAAVVLDRTNFYGEAGGQVGDGGRLTGPAGRFAVGQAKLAGHCVLHVGVMEQGTMSAGQTVTAEVDAARADTRRNHTATHLLNWALRRVLGGQVDQAGSVVEPRRLRFDFTWGKALTPDQLAEVERLVNERILADDPVVVREMPLAEARRIPGVRAVFGERYPDPVRVVSIGGGDSGTGEAESVEFCGGTHLDRTSQAGLFKIVSEESVAKGVRRITAVTGREALRHVQLLDEAVRAASALLRAPAERIGERIAAMQKEIKQLRKRPAGGAEDFRPEFTLASPVGKVLIGTVRSSTPAAMRKLCDLHRQKGAAAMLVASADAKKVTLIAMVSDALVKQGKVSAGEWVKAASAAVGGSGGGKPTMAQAGGKDSQKVPEALRLARDWINKRLSPPDQDDRQ